MLVGAIHYNEENIISAYKNRVLIWHPVEHLFFSCENCELKFVPNANNRNGLTETLLGFAQNKTNTNTKIRTNSSIIPLIDGTLALTVDERLYSAESVLRFLSKKLALINFTSFFANSSRVQNILETHNLDIVNCFYNPLSVIRKVSNSLDLTSIENFQVRLTAILYGHQTKIGLSQINNFLVSPSAPLLFENELLYNIINTFRVNKTAVLPFSSNIYNQHISNVYVDNTAALLINKRFSAAWKAPLWLRKTKALLPLKDIKINYLEDFETLKSSKMDLSFYDKVDYSVFSTISASSKIEKRAEHYLSVISSLLGKEAKKFFFAKCFGLNTSITYILDSAENLVIKKTLSQINNTNLHSEKSAQLEYIISSKLQFLLNFITNKSSSMYFDNNSKFYLLTKNYIQQAGSLDFPLPATLFEDVFLSHTLSEESWINNSINLTGPWTLEIPYRRQLIFNVNMATQKNANFLFSNTSGSAVLNKIIGEEDSLFLTAIPSILTKYCVISSETNNSLFKNRKSKRGHIKLSVQAYSNPKFRSRVTDTMLTTAHLSPTSSDILSISKFQNFYSLKNINSFSFVELSFNKGLKELSFECNFKTEAEADLSFNKDLLNLYASKWFLINNFSVLELIITKNLPKALIEIFSAEKADLDFENTRLFNISKSQLSNRSLVFLQKPKNFFAIGQKAFINSSAINLSALLEIEELFLSVQDFDTKVNFDLSLLYYISGFFAKTKHSYFANLWLSYFLDLPKTIIRASIDTNSDLLLKNRRTVEMDTNVEFFVNSSLFLDSWLKVLTPKDGRPEENILIRQVYNYSPQNGCII